jgi:hypothetical protein
MRNNINDFLMKYVCLACNRHYRAETPCCPFCRSEDYYEVKDKKSNETYFDKWLDGKLK